MRTGVTLQTMHPRHFDQGDIIDQTRPPGLEHKCQTVRDLSSVLAPLGAEMLMKAIRSRSFETLPPPQPQKIDSTNAAPRPAPKLTSEDFHINWQTWSAAEILRRQQVLRRLWNHVDLVNGTPRRVIWDSAFWEVPSVTNVPADRVGKVYLADQVSKAVRIGTCDGKLLQIEKVKLDGKSRGLAAEALSIRNHRYRYNADFEGLHLS